MRSSCVAQPERVDHLQRVLEEVIEPVTAAEFARQIGAPGRDLSDVLLWLGSGGDLPPGEPELEAVKREKHRVTDRIRALCDARCFGAAFSEGHNLIAIDQRLADTPARTFQGLAFKVVSILQSAPIGHFEEQVQRIIPELHRFIHSPDARRLPIIISAEGTGTQIKLFGMKRVLG